MVRAELRRPFERTNGSQRQNQGVTIRTTGTAREKLLEYKTYNEAQDAYGYGFITEEEFDEIVEFLEKSQQIVDEPTAEELALKILLN